MGARHRESKDVASTWIEHAGLQFNLNTRENDMSRHTRTVHGILKMIHYCSSLAYLLRLLVVHVAFWWPLSLHVLTHISFLIREQVGVETLLLISQRPEIWLRLALESAPPWHWTHFKKFLGT